MNAYREGIFPAGMHVTEGLQDSGFFYAGLASLEVLVFDVIHVAQEKGGVQFCRRIQIYT